MYAPATRSGSRVFQAASAARTFCRAVSAVNGGNGGRDMASSCRTAPVGTNYRPCRHDLPAPSTEHGAVAGPDLLESARAPAGGAGRAGTLAGPRPAPAGSSARWPPRSSSPASSPARAGLGPAGPRAEPTPPHRWPGVGRATRRWTCTQSPAAGWWSAVSTASPGRPARDGGLAGRCDVALLVQCPSRAGPLTLRVARRRARPPCASAGTLVTTADMAAAGGAGGGPVTVRAAGHRRSGAWVVAVLTRFRSRPGAAPASRAPQDAYRP